MTDEEFDQILKNISSYGVGIANAPIDVFRYPALATNEALELLGLRSHETSSQVRDQINDWSDRPPFFPDEFNDYREWLASESPEMESLGQVAGGVLGGGAMKALPYLLQKGSKLKRMAKANPAILVAIKEIMEEYGVEPEVDDVLNHLEN